MFFIRLEWVFLVESFDIENVDLLFSFENYVLIDMESLIFFKFSS
jgi:hypothetical protein